MVFTKHAAYLHPRIKVVILVPKLTVIENIRNSLLYCIKKKQKNNGHTVLGWFVGLREPFSKSFPVVFALVLCRNV